MKTTLVFAVLAMFFLPSCDDGDNHTPRYGEVGLTLEETASFLATNTTWLTGEVMVELAARRPVRLKDIIPGIRTPDVLLKGVVYDVYVESYFRTADQLAALKKDGATTFRVALDPDEFYVPQSIDDLREGNATIPSYEIPTFLYTEGSETPVEEVISIGPDEVYDEPIFFLSLSEAAGSGALSKALGNPSSPQPGTYLSFIGAKLKVKMDESNEEFELYFSNGPSPVDDPFVSYSDHMFNGGSAKNDASGRARVYPDIEKVSSMQIADQPIAIKLLGGALFRIAAIESDQAGTGGIYNRNDKAAGQTSSIAVDYYNMANAIDAIEYSVTTRYTVYALTQLNDDRYVETGVRNISEGNLNARIAGGGYMETDNAPMSGGGSASLDQINWRLGKVTY